jgi:hypothetical protein
MPTRSATPSRASSASCPTPIANRYDVAYERGRAQARSRLLFGGLALGSALGAALTFLFDPERGRRRRAELGQRLTALRNDLQRTAEGRSKDLRNRAQGFAIERGLAEPPNGSGADRPAESAYGSSYERGFGATEADPSAPGGQVPDPIKPEEVAVYGASGPVGGAGAEADDELARERLEGR